jgi:hypothetical protein
VSATLAFAIEMRFTEHMSSPTSEPVNMSYDGPPIVEVTLEATDFRIDSGKQGTALSISTRPTGSWDWTFAGEARWDGSDLRCRTFDRSVLVELSTAFAAALANLD